MGLPELVNGLCEHLRIEPLEPDAQGVYEVVFDEGLDVEIVPLTATQMLVRSQIAEVPQEKDQQESFFREHLQHNLLNLQGQECSLSLDSEAGIVWLFQMARSDRIDVREFCSLINTFVNTLEWWRNLETTEATTTPMSMMPMNILRP